MYHFRTSALVLGLLGLTIAACSASDIVGRSSGTTGTENPDAVKSEQGARDFIAGVVEQFAEVTALYVRESGLLTDELRTSATTGGVVPVHSTDLRMLPESESYAEDPSQLFTQLSRLRMQSREARWIVRMYAPMLKGPFVGRMYAIEGMAHLMLADLYCSGIPLSYLDDAGHYIYSAGLPTTTVYETAITLFDSAIVQSPDSIRILQFAKVGKARALLALKRYEDAEAVASEVENGFSFAVEFRNRNTNSNGNRFRRDGDTYGWSGMTVGDAEGGHGIPYATSGDPRSAVLSGFTLPAIQIPIPYDRYVARKYADRLGNDPIVVANAIEMRLIEAEVALQAQNPSRFLSLLNVLRTSCEQGSPCPSPAPAGTGGIANLPPLQDPGVEPLAPGQTAWDARVDLLFRERAYWLFLTGRRQGDLRRLIRNYPGRIQENVYPVGDYFSTIIGAVSTYGSDVTFPVPGIERDGNPKFTGCIDREA